MHRLTGTIAILATALALLAGCESAPSKPPPPQAPPPPPPLQEAPPAYRSQLHTEIAAGFYERGQMEVALQELDIAVKLNPQNAKAYNVYGLVYALLGQDDKAQQNFQQALSIAPDDSEIRQNWGWYLCTHGRAGESLAEFDRAVRNPLYKTPDVSLVNAGKCAASIGEKKRAEEYFRRALTVSPAPLAAYNLALLLYREGKADEARSLMRRVMAQAAPPPEALFLGLCIERKLGDRAAENSYTSQLRNRFPESAETKSIAGGNCE